MNPNIQNLAVQIVRFVDERFPGWVASEFTDANEIRHTIIDKVPTLTTEVLDESSRYPQSGSVSCEVLAQWQDEGGRKLVRITTPGIESTEGFSEFIVPSDQLSTAPI
jgi:hypothetical protein